VNFFLDENFPRKAIPILNSRGFSAHDIRGSDFEGEDDKHIFERAQKHQAVFLTTDKDFFHTIQFLYESHHGIIVIALSQPNAEKILEKLERALEFIKSFDIYSQCILLTGNGFIFNKMPKNNSMNVQILEQGKDKPL
jgi:predicted nuclease of predicted toxin-antitoxin system